MKWALLTTCVMAAACVAEPDALLDGGLSEPDGDFGIAPDAQVDAAVEPVAPPVPIDGSVGLSCDSDGRWTIWLRLSLEGTTCSEDVSAMAWVWLPLTYLAGGQAALPQDAVGYLFTLPEAEVSGTVHLEPVEFDLFDDDIVPWERHLALKGTVSLTAQSGDAISTLEGRFEALACVPWRGYEQAPECAGFPADRMGE